MLNKLQKLRVEREQGFTLIELLVVILIIGILAAIAIPAFLNQRKSAVDSTVESDVKNAASAVETTSISAKGQPVTLVDGDTAEGTNASEYDYKLLSTKTGAAIATGTTKVSEGTKLKFSGNSETGFIIEGNNEAGKEATIESGGVVYDSGNGGLQTDRAGNTPNPDAGGNENADGVLAHSMSRVGIENMMEMYTAGWTDAEFWSDGRILLKNAVSETGEPLNGTFYATVYINWDGGYEPTARKTVTFNNGEAIVNTSSYDASTANYFDIIFETE